MEYAIIIILVIVVAFSIRSDSKGRAVKINKIFEGRESLSSDSFYDKYYSEKGVSRNIVLETLKLLESELEADLSKLIPEDDFSANLRFLFEFDSMADVSLIEGIENTFSIKITDAEAESIKTINDLIFFIHNRQKAPNKALNLDAEKAPRPLA